MNNEELIKKVSENSGVNVDDCERVLNALEDVLDNELSNSKSVAGAFDKIYKLMTYFNKKGRV
ncbi:HU family DNA-binding protein [Cytobacillus purgationiresistens]|uniref:Nucleoid DNA-binding protein n=1 Tax=Cytobacillus purgationiresistens TaxID=863449 RepID=A0ABU0ANY4_9BACI|nr:HU family DNA-binding protein [Cytobacillus purgationiresistens]MDQ0272745.1 nucleoid DNA-binding protein [Cytobacillus purgationiresistens]